MSFPKFASCIINRIVLIALALTLPGTACARPTITPLEPTRTAESPVILSPSTVTPTPTGCLGSETAELVWPQLMEVQPDQIAPGGTVKVIGSGGFLRCGPSAYNESARQFQLYLDDKPISMMTCYIHYCGQEFIVPADTSLGTHVISVEGGSEINVQVTGN